MAANMKQRKGQFIPMKKSPRPHGNYCKICGEYKANRSSLARATPRISVKPVPNFHAEKAETQTITRLMNFNMGRLHVSEKKWLENRVHDRRLEVVSLAWEIYNIHFPYTE